MHTVILIHPCLAFVQRHCKEQYLRKSAYVVRRYKYRTATVVNVLKTFTVMRLAMNPKARSFSTIIGYYLLVVFGRPTHPSYAAGTKKPRSPRADTQSRQAYTLYINAMWSALYLKLF